MRFRSLSSAARCAAFVVCALAFAAPAAEAAPDPVASPESTAGAGSASSPLPEIGHVRAVTPFCRLIIDDSATLAGDQLADIGTTIEALRILAYTPFDRDIFTVHRAARVLATLSDRLMASRRGEAHVRVADLRKAALGTESDPPRPGLARFAGALDGAHSESSRVAHEISSALSVLGTSDLPVGGAFLPDFRYAHDPRFARAELPVPFPVDPDLERFPADHLVENGPLHVYARSIALDMASSLELMVGSINEARTLLPTAFAGCLDTNVQPSPAASVTP